MSRNMAFTILDSDRGAFCAAIPGKGPESSTESQEMASKEAYLLSHWAEKVLPLPSTTEPAANVPALIMPAARSSSTGRPQRRMAPARGWGRRLARNAACRPADRGLRRSAGLPEQAMSCPTWADRGLHWVRGRSEHGAIQAQGRTLNGRREARIGQVRLRSPVVWPVLL